jgi:hypothetical protein
VNDETVGTPVSGDLRGQRHDPPTIIRVAPSDTAANVGARTAVVVNFSMNPNTVVVSLNPGAPLRSIKKADIEGGLLDRPEWTAKERLWRRL